MDKIELPKISIITPSYNQGDYIRYTIDSVLDQEYPNLEYFIIDGGSTDSTLSILEGYGKKICWISEKDRGQSHALNKGLRKATGEIIAILNSDDLYERGTLIKVGEYFVNHPNVKWVTGKCRAIDHKGNEIRKAVTLYKNFWLITRSKKVLKILNYIDQPATFWRREILEKIGFFNEKLHYSMDYDYWLRIQKFYDLKLINSYLASLRFHPTSKGGASANALVNESLEVLKMHEPLPFFINLHKLHDAITILIYSRLFGIEVT